MEVSQRSSGPKGGTLAHPTESLENHSPMRPPFPGMDPWLEHPAIWPDVHNRLITAVADELTPRVAPKYYLGLEQRVYALEPGELVFVGRPDIVVGRPASVDVAYEPEEAEESTAVGILDVEVPINDKLQEWFLEIHDVETGTLVTVLEILSPFNKIHPQGRGVHQEKDEDLWVADQPRRDRLASRRPADAASTQAGSIGLSD